MTSSFFHTTFLSSPIQTIQQLHQSSRSRVFQQARQYHHYSNISQLCKSPRSTRGIQMWKRRKGKKSSHGGRSISLIRPNIRVQHPRVTVLHPTVKMIYPRFVVEGRKSHRLPKQRTAFGSSFRRRTCRKKKQTVRKRRGLRRQK